MNNSVIDPIATVLIVDDTPGNLALLSDTLSEAGYRVLVATDGLAALEQIDYLPPDIILMDVVMPGIDGFETCKRLKANPITSDIPLLFMTGLSELDNLLRGFGEGGLDYIVKPIRPPEVLARIEVHLALARAKQRTNAALKLSRFAAFALDNNGIVTWLTPAASDILSTCLPNDCVEIGGLLPKPLATWALNQINSKTPANDTFDYQGLELSLTACLNAQEYLVLIKETGHHWDLEALKNAMGLTLREAEILMWISRGKTNKEVGLILESSHRTVNKHLEHIYEKLGVATRAAAVAMVMQRTTSK